VAAAREAADALAAITGPALEPTLKAVLENCRIALKALADQHAHLADRSAMDLDGDTRWATRWRLAAAAIAYANALVDLTDGGYVDSALPTQRALYEAVGVLGVVNGDAEQTILDHWLEDREVQPKKVRAAAERRAKRSRMFKWAGHRRHRVQLHGRGWSDPPSNFFATTKRITEEAAEHGVEPHVIDVSAQMEQIYSVLSDVSHVRRSGCAAWPACPCAARCTARIQTQSHARTPPVSTVLAVEATILGVGDALAAFYGGPYYAQIIKPIQDGLMASARQQIALTDSVR